MNKPKQKQDKGKVVFSNPLESLKDIGKSTADQMKYEASRIPQDFLNQFLGINTNTKYSGEINPGSSVSIKDIYSGKQAELDGQKKQLQFERVLFEEEKMLVEKKTNDLKMQLKVLQEELILIATKTQGLAEQTQIATMQASVEPGIYHVVFFEKLLGFIRSFRQKIESASNWLASANKRASKKNVWGANFKKHGTKYLLSSEHYIARSAG